MYDILKEIAEYNNWVFKYAKRDHLNLFDENEQKDVIHIFLDPVEREKERDDQGQAVKDIYTGNFLMVYSSDIDEEDYDTRYQEYIKPALDKAFDILDESLTCQYELELDVFRAIEVINVLDYNFDGLLISFQAKKVIE